MYDLHIGPDRSVFGLSLHLDRTDQSKQLRWTEPIGPGDTDGPDRTNSIGSIRLGLKSVGPGRYRSGPDRGCPYLVGMRAFRAEHEPPEAYQFVYPSLRLVGSPLDHCGIIMSQPTGSITLWPGSSVEDSAWQFDRCS